MKTLIAALILLLSFVGSQNSNALMMYYPTLTQVTQDASQIGIVTVIRATNQSAPFEHCDAEYTARWVDSITDNSGLVRFADSAGHLTAGKYYVMFLRHDGPQHVLIRYPALSERVSGVKPCPQRPWLQQPVLAPIEIDYPATRKPGFVWIKEPALSHSGEEVDWLAPDLAQAQPLQLFERKRIDWRVFCRAIAQRITPTLNKTWCEHRSSPPALTANQQE